jgi:hypothetical protein
MSWCQDRINAVEKSIEAAEEAESAILSGEVSSYTFDSGQTRQTVTRHQIASLRIHIDTLYNRRATLLARCNGAARTVRPDW